MATDAVQNFRALVGATFPTIWAAERAKIQEDSRAWVARRTWEGMGSIPARLRHS